MNEIQKLKSYRLLKIVIDIGFWIGVVFCIGMTVFLFINQGSTVFTLNISSGSGFVINNGTLSQFPLPFQARVLTFAGINILRLSLVWLFRSIVRSIGDGTPFIHKNVKRIRYAALLLFAQSYIFMFIGYFVAQHHRIIAEQAGLQPVLIERLTILPDNAIFMLCLLVLAEIFRYGCILQGAYDTTV